MHTLYENENDLVGLEKVDKNGILLFRKNTKPVRIDQLCASENTLLC